MKASKAVIKFTIGACFFLITSAAHAENWVDTGHETLIDVDSIRKDADGLVYYREKKRTFDEDDNYVWRRASKAAFDCQQGFYYHSTLGPDWRSKGLKIKPDTMGSVLMDFVCSRVR